MDRCLVSMGALYRNWRGTLVREYMRKKKSPCDEYNISAEDWEAFKKLKQTPEFEVEI